jgi:hypothetical protein
MRYIATFVLLLASSAFGAVVSGPTKTTVSARDGGFASTCGNIVYRCPDTPSDCFLYADCGDGKGGYEHTAVRLNNCVANL